MSKLNLWKNNISYGGNSYFKDVASGWNSLFGKKSKPTSTVVTSDIARNKVNDINSSVSNYRTRKSSVNNIPNINNTQVKSSSSTLDAINKGLDRFKKGSDEEDDGEDRLKSMFKKIENIRAGNFQYSDLEQGQIDKLNEQGRNLSLRQSRANENYQSGVTGGEYRSGRMRYAQELADDAIYNSVQVGVDALDELDRKTQESVQRLEDAMKEDRINDILKEYDMIQSYDAQRDKTYQALIDSMNEYEKLQFDMAKENKAEYEDGYNLAQKEGFDGSYTEYLAYLQEIKKKSKYPPSSNQYVPVSNIGIPIQGQTTGGVTQTTGNGLVW